MKNVKTLQLTRAAIIAALYSTLTVVLDFLIPQYGAIQVRIAECLTILPLFFVEAIPGVAIGCLIANFFGFGAFDIVIGTMTTLVAAILTRLLKKIQWGIIPPILLNAFYVPALLIWAKVIPAEGYWLEFLFVAIGQSIAIIGLGIPLYFALKRLQPKVPYLHEANKPQGVATQEAATPTTVPQEAATPTTVPQEAAPQDSAPQDTAPPHHE